MKRNYFVGQLVLLVLIGMLAGCKKDSISVNEETFVSEKGIANLKSWYNGRGTADAMVTANQNVPNLGTLDWSATMYNSLSKSYITPIINSVQKTSFSYLVANTDSEGSILSGKYVFIFVNSVETKLLLSPKINAAFVEGSLVPNNFNGAIIEQDLQNKYIASKHYENGKINSAKKDEAVYKFKTKVYEQQKNNSEPDPSIVGDPTCIDWYWQTWIDGVLVNEVYQFTTCNAGGGGGGGTSNGNGNSCSSAAIQAFANAGSAMSGTLNTVDEFYNGTTLRRAYNWKIYSANTWGLFSYERATLEKKSYPNNYTRWEFETFDHVQIAEVGMNLGGSRTFIDLGATINMTSTHQTAWVQIDFSVANSLACSQFPPVVLAYNANKTFYAPSSLVIVPNPPPVN